MTDLDLRLRGLAHELVLDPPDAAPFDDLGAVVHHLDAHAAPARNPRRLNGGRALVAAALVVLVVVVGLALVDRLDTPPARPGPGPGCVPDPGRFTGPDGQTFGPLVRDPVQSARRLIENGDQQIAETRARLDAKNLAPAELDSDPDTAQLESAIARRERSVQRLAELQRARAAGDEASRVSVVGSLLVPDLVRVTCPGGAGVFGWARSSDVLPQLAGPTLDALAVNGPVGTAMCDASGANVGTLQTSPRYPVFADDGTTVVGHVYPPIGYRPLGREPRYYPDRNGLRPCNGDMTALPTQPASSRAQLAWANAVNHDVDYRSAYAGGIGLTDPPDPLPYSRGRYTTFADGARRGGANQAKRLGEPYNPADLLTPVRDEAGRIVRYSAQSMARGLTPDEVSDRRFDLCPLQIEHEKEQIAFGRRVLREHPEAFGTPPLGVTEEEFRQMREQQLDRDPAESVGCKKG